MKPEEWDVLTNAAALLVAQERIFGTDRTLTAKIDAVIAAKEADMEKLVASRLDECRDLDTLVPAVNRLSGEKGILIVARYMVQRKYDQMLSGKPKAYLALHGVITLSRTFRAAVRASVARLLHGQCVLSDSERELAVRVILTAGSEFLD